MTTHTGIRTRILEHIADSGMSTSAELALALGVHKKTILDNAGTARAEGYLTSQRDDVTGHMGYVLTAKGKARVKNGHQTIGNGKSLMENVQACAERDAESRIDVVAPGVAEQAPVVTADTEEEAPPAADPALLAMANKVLHEHLAGVAHVLRGCGLEALRNIEDGSDLQMHAAALSGAYQRAMEIRDKQDDELETMEQKIVELRNLLDERCADIKELRAENEALAAAAISNPERKPIGYAVMKDIISTSPRLLYADEQSAREAAEDALGETAVSRVYVAAVMASAKMEVTWKEDAQ